MESHVQCPTCGQTVAWTDASRWRPFCSERCKLLDLGAWADESHRIPGDAPPDPGERPDASAMPRPAP